MSKNSGSKIISASRCRWRDFARNWFFPAMEAVNRSTESSSGLLMTRKFPSRLFPWVNKMRATNHKLKNPATYTGRETTGRWHQHFRKASFQIVFCPHKNTNRMSSNSSRLKIEKLLFCDELFRTVGLTTKINLGLKFPWHSIDKPKRHTCHPSTIYGDKLFRDHNSLHL